MKKLTIILLAVASIAAFAQQSGTWKYKQMLYFPAEDTLYVQPYLLTVMDDGRVFVASSKVTNSNARNMIFVLNPGDTVFTKFIDYYNNGDSDTLLGNIGTIRGIGALGNNLYVNAHIPFPRFSTTVSSQYVYIDTDTNKVEKFGFNINGSGYGTYVHGIALTRDSILMTAITFNSSIRFYNFNTSIGTPARGSWVPMTTYPPWPGPLQTGGFDVVRDVATIPGADYTNPETPFFTSRNSLTTANVTGGIGIWTGGDQLNPSAYQSTKVSDAVRDLEFDTAIPYGITADTLGRLWVAGTDSTRRWVKAFEVLVNFAQEVVELPGQYSMSNPDPNGAPMRNPSDVALTRDGKYAYVADGGSKHVYKFWLDPGTDVKDNNSAVADFRLNQNYPNPFNPSTLISYSLPKASNVKLVVTNVIGKEVATLYNGLKDAGTHSAVFNAENLPSGIYFYTLTTDFGMLSRKMMLVK